MNEKIELLIENMQKKQIWDEEPVFCFSSDIDWASEDVMKEFFNIVNPFELKPTLFVTHESAEIEKNYQLGTIDRGIHPNFLPDSSHGNSYKEIAETVVKFAPESYGFRCHRYFDVTDITHLLVNEYNYKYSSNLGTIMQSNIKPILHESGLITIPIFFEDGTHLYNKLDLDIKKYIKLFTEPGIKIISFHPMNFVFNSPTMPFMRQIKDSLSREAYNNITTETIERLGNKEAGIGKTIIDIIHFVKQNNYKVLSMNQIYQQIVS